MTLPVYHMSESGGCPRALAASRLGYEPVQQDSSKVLKEGKRHELHIVEDLREMGYEIETAGECIECKEEFGESGISGFHIEVETPLIRLIGHIDGYLRIDGEQFPCEFKSMGLYVFQKFLKEGFNSNPGYEAQVCCYITYCKKPLLYVVKNRNDGALARFSVAYADIAIPGHNILPISITFDEILNKLHSIELAVIYEELLDCTTPERDRKWCPFRYLCQTPDKELPEVKEEDVVKAALLWKEAKEMESQAKDLLEQAKNTLIAHAKKVNKFSVAGLNVSYHGIKSKSYIDEKLLKELVSEDIFNKVHKKSKPYESIIIRRVGER